MDHGKPLAAARFAAGRAGRHRRGRPRLTWDGDTGARVRDLVPGGRRRRATPGRSPGGACSSSTTTETRASGTRTAARSSTGSRRAPRARSCARRSSKAAAGWRPAAPTGPSSVFDLASGATVADARLREPHRRPPGPNLSRVFAVAFDQTAAALVAGCEDVAFRIWDFPAARSSARRGSRRPGCSRSRRRAGG